MAAAPKARDCGWISLTGTWKTTTLVAALRVAGMIAPMVLDTPISSDWVAIYVPQALVPQLRLGEVVMVETASEQTSIPSTGPMC